VPKDNIKTISLAQGDKKELVWNVSLEP